jgi:hypothetical protein
MRFGSTSGSQYLRLGAVISCVAWLGAASGCAQKDATPGAAAPAAASAPSAPPTAEAQRAGGASFFAVHMLSDFEAFKKYFEEGAAERAKAGVKGYLLTRLDDGRVVIHFFADDVEAVKQTMRSPELQEYLGRKGAPEASLVWLTRDVLVKLPAVPPTGQTYSLYVKAKVGDFAALERGFRERHALFAEHGVIAEGLHHSVVNEELAVLHFVGTARDKLEALSKRREFLELMTLAQGQGNVEPLIGVDVARDRAR